jgi:hypothetical protein
MFGLGGTEILIVLVVIVVIIIIPLYFTYKYGYNKGYLKALKDQSDKG